MRRFLINHSVWMHFTLILILSYMMIQLSHFIFVQKFLYWVLGMTFFSIPALIFVVSRDAKIKQRDIKYWGLWGLIFVVYPIALFFLKIDIITLPFAYQLVNFDINGAYTFITVSILFLILETILWWMNKNNNKIRTHLLFGGLSVWKLSIIVVSIFCIFATFSSHYFREVTQNDSGLLTVVKFFYYLIQLFIIYISYYIYYFVHHKILYNVILKERGIIPYFLGLGMAVILIAPMQNILISLFPVVQDLKLHPMAMVDLLDDINFGLPVFVLAISFPMIVIIEWYKQAKTVAELKEEKSKTELSLLRQQINPHFFFNTLNNLYSMSLNEDKETPETILQLSEMMRYVIYKGKEEKVKLKDEVKYMKDYINLQMIRVHKAVDLKIDFEVKNEEAEVSPLMFIILIENAFKHGIEPAGFSSTLHISLKEKDGEIDFNCYNSKPESELEDGDGIGLTNLKKRLQIVYPDRHEFLIDDKQNSYKSTLKITL